jgi:hypothetical protein
VCAALLADFIFHFFHFATFEKSGVKKKQSCKTASKALLSKMK